VPKPDRTMSQRKSTREKHPPVRFPDDLNENEIEIATSNPPDTAEGSNSYRNEASKAGTSTSSQRRLLEIELKRIEQVNKLEKTLEEREAQRQREHEVREAERQRQLEELEAKELERQRRLEVKELERQRQLETKELERQKRLLQMQAELESASVSMSQAASVYGSQRSESKVGRRIDLEAEEESNCKVERWLNENEPSVQMSSSAIVTSAVQQLADSLRHALQPMQSVMFKKQLPTFSGKPDEWPMFYSAYEKTAKMFSEEDNLVRVRNSLEGDAFKMVKPLFVSSRNLESIIKTLSMRFGKPEFILESMMKKTRLLLPVKEDDICSLIEFSTTILNFATTAENLHLETYMLNPQLLNECLSKLPYSLKYRWAEHVNSTSLSSPDMKTFSTWLENQCTILSIYFRPPEENVERKKTNLRQVFTSSNDSSSKCLFCHEAHESEKCKVFRKADVSQRWKMVAEKKLCFFCFRHHQLKYCKIKKTCGINDCKLFHHRLLHTDKKERLSAREQVSTVQGNVSTSCPNTTAQGNVSTSCPNTAQGNASTSCSKKEVIGNHVDGSTSGRVLLRVCPVTLYGPSYQLDTYALLDDGSTVTLLDATVAKKLGVEGKTKPLTTCWSNSTRHFDPTSQSVEIKIKGLFEDNIFSLKNVRTQSPLDLPQQSVDSVKLRNRWTHLESIDQPLPTAHSKPTILIGQDNCHLILTRKVIEGPPNSPVLSWSYLGWSLHGKCPEFTGRVDNFTLTSFQHDKLHDLVKGSFEIDNYGASPVENKSIKNVEDERAMSILEKTTRKVGERYESGLLWKSDDFKFPPSYENALKRLKHIERKMAKDPTFKEEYTKKIVDYKEKGYIRKLSEHEASILNDRTYYLPHFGVVNPNKPNKLRLVFDAAAKSNGVSFNDALLSGPDLLNPLPAVLIKFRVGKFAIAGDIKEMFHQVRIRGEDVDSQRFLWRQNTHDPPDTYIMEAMTFGSTCSPSTALYVVNENAKRFSSIYPEASKSILTKEYMDDLLDSVDSEEEAKTRVKEIIEIHKSGGFQICNWISNSKSVLSDIPEELKSNSTKQLKPDGNLPTERVLGMWWDSESDNFVFHRNADKLQKMEVGYPTKREVLKAAMSIFDPLGLVTPTTIKGRMLVQEIWRTKTTWDEVLTMGLTKKWQEWLEEVKQLQYFIIPRCYFKTLMTKEIELHIFVDASEEAYAAVGYLRHKNANESTSENMGYKTMLVMSRAKVAPLKPTTIPRLELQAAVLGCRLVKTIIRDIDISIVRKIFWSDSVTVLHWIKSDPRSFKQFVSNRLGEILEVSQADEWKWVPTKHNPADVATRSNKKFTISTHEFWTYGPEFLKYNPSHWPKQPTTLQTTDSEEAKQKFVGLLKEDIDDVVNIERFSSWDKVTRVTAWVLRYIGILQSRIKTNTTDRLKMNLNHRLIPELQPDEILKAEHVLVLKSQNKSFQEEKALLRSKKSLPKSSKIFTLAPFVDEKDLIRMSTRIQNSPEISDDRKYPIVLDGKSHVAKLIVKSLHEKCFHQGIETVVNMTREKYWILKIKGVAKHMQRTCMVCQINNAKPKPPHMSPLPISRVSQVQHPFFYTGVDYFGPIEVTVGRRHEKRYGVLFTCLSTRAIHLEVAHSLNTESCVMAIQRFISRRPCPSEMFSDNGTNFVATEKELRNAVKQLNNAQIQRNVVKHGIKWNFIPPRAPHMGGCWERLVRSVKTALRSVMRCQYPKDEELQTFLVRAEFIINSRPLTHVSLDPLDPQPLTPNHFLREAFKIEIMEDQLCKRQLSRVRSLLDNFWKRWIREYLPCLSRQCKWHKRVEPPKIGDLAIIIDENNPRNTWPMGKITSTYPGQDGVIRIVDVQTNKGTFRRPLTKVAVLGGEKM
jgi:hypothetical protein